jgi:DNA modification methylase
MVKIQLINADVLAGLAMLPDESVQCVVTSPPYWGLRDYGVEGAYGLEPTIEKYVAKMVEVFREVRRVLPKDGVLFLNLGDSYMAHVGNQNPQTKDHKGSGFCGPNRTPQSNLKPKDLCGIPWRVALALQADGWWLRSDIIWSKPNPMPESCTDRPTKAHEYIFLLTKSAHYFWDAEAVREKVGEPTRMAASFRDGGVYTSNRSFDNAGGKAKDTHGDGPQSTGRNLRTVWEIATAPFPQAHFATYPPELVRRCVAAGSKEGDTILDPFSGAGTTALVAAKLGRNAIGIELNPEYVEMSRKRILGELGMLADVKIIHA